MIGSCPQRVCFWNNVSLVFDKDMSFNTANHSNLFHLSVGGGANSQKNWFSPRQKASKASLKCAHE